MDNFGHRKEEAWLLIMMSLVRAQQGEPKKESNIDAVYIALFLFSVYAGFNDFDVIKQKVFLSYEW